jgi:hypothetical protein
MIWRTKVIILMESLELERGKTLSFLIFNNMRTIKLFTMEKSFITLTEKNCRAKVISHRNNVIVDIYEDEQGYTAVINKKYFNQISQFGSVDGRLKLTEDGLLIFEGFNFK